MLAAWKASALPVGNEQRAFIHAATGELNADASHGQPLPLGSYGGHGAFQACPARNVRSACSRPHDTLAAGNRHQPVPSDVPLHACTISTTQCRDVLGTQTFSLLREAIMHQQDTFVEQLWDLHRLARVQGQKTVQSSAEATLGLHRNRLDSASGIFSREKQKAVHAQTMDSIVSLDTLPASLRRHKAQAAPAAEAGRVTPAPATAHATGSKLRPESGPSNHSSNHVAVPLAASSGDKPPVQSLQQAPDLGGVPKQSNIPLAPGGTLRDLCNLHNVGDKSASTSAQAKQAKTNPPAPQANSSAAQGQAALETLLPSVDTHAQWFQRTYGNAPQGPMPAPGQQLNDVFNVPLPTYSADPKGPAASQFTPQFSNSLWSGQSFMCYPGSNQPMFAGGVPQRSHVTWGTSAATFPNLSGHANFLPQQPTPTPSLPLTQEGVQPQGLLQPHMSANKLNGFDSASPFVMPQQPASGSTKGNEVAPAAEQAAGQTGKVSSTDKSAASILLSLKGK